MTHPANFIAMAIAIHACSYRTYQVIAIAIATVYHLKLATGNTE